MTDKELHTLNEILTNLETWSTWNKTFANEMIGICSKMRNLLADRKTEPQIDWHYSKQDGLWYPYKHEDEPQTKIRLIDADATILAVIKATTYGDTLRAVREQPTIDVVNVVKCEECKYKSDCEQEVLLSEMYSEIEDTAHITYCSYGKREDEQ